MLVRKNQVLAVFIEKENRAQHSLTVGFDQAGDTGQDFVQGCVDKDHLQRIEHFFARQSMRESSRCWRCLIRKARWRSGVCHKQPAY
jgi:hypothetical protein